MTISMGGLGLILGHTPFSAIHARVDIKTLLCALVFAAIILLIAYLTNPSENSFRTYLTEQSFRQHLSRLDYNNDDEDCSLEDAIRVNGHYSPKRPMPTPSPGQDNTGPPFHFANRASVSLRTPKHVFHTFGMFTIAAMLPLATPGADRDGSMMADSWFIGAFGKWWRGGVIETWYHDVIACTKDQESWTSGIMAIKALDKLQEFNGLPFNTKTTHTRAVTRGTPPKLRNRERSAQRLGTLPARSSTPPPLPKSASLPLHTTRLPAQLTDHRNHTQPHSTQQSPLALAPVSADVRLGSLSRSPSGLFEHSPLIQEVLRQISLSKSTSHDLREQLNTYQADASAAHETLQVELDSCRERKRVEDISRAELKSRTKTLEDTKRGAEGLKREAEKRLKAAHTARDNANQRRDHLDREINVLQARVVEDGDKIHHDDGSKREVADALSKKRQEIKVAEDVVGALNLRAKELEEKIASERERLQRVRERAELRKQDQSFYPLHQTNNNETPNTPWSTTKSYSTYDSVATDLDDSTQVGSNDHSRASSGSGEVLPSPRPRKISLGPLSNFNLTHSDSNANAISLRAKGYSIFDDDIASLHSQHSGHSQNHPHAFSPFRDGGAVSPMSSSLIPTSLIQSLDGSSENLSRSFQSESDPFMDREWRSPNALSTIEASLNTSPISLLGPSASDFGEHDPFEVRHHGYDHQTSRSMMEMQRAGMPSRADSDPSTVVDDDGSFDASFSSPPTERAPGRRWFSPRGKGLNPDAKVFSLNLGKRTSASTLASTRSSFDALNPTTGGLLGHLGMGSASSSSSNSLLRAFAPSPAEREALQRALGGGGGSTNASLERLPSLSDVSIPSSPVQRTSVLPSWFQSLPGMRKSNFSPWDDDEPVHGAR